MVILRACDCIHLREREREREEEEKEEEKKEKKRRRVAALSMRGWLPAKMPRDAEKN